ncbi:MAG: IS91 family transposase [Planctomycetota bacterium]
MADIFAAHADSFLEACGGLVSIAKQKVLRRIIDCRTGALGAHVQRCDQCDYERRAYNSCRDRHCPKCQAAARGEWLEAQEARLLPVHYFHVVFTLPEPIAQMALQNKKVVYNNLMRASAETLQTIAQDPKHLGAKIGFLSVLHTWGQNLLHHPHVHCVVTGGGLSPDRERWISCPKDYLFPVNILGSVFRGKFIQKARMDFQEGRLSFQGKLAHLNEPRAFESLLASTYRTEWVVYAKKPFGGPKKVLRYLARYTHRVAISNSRLLTHADGKVSFRWKDYRDGNRCKVMTLCVLEFIRRFLLHVLPKGFHRIRHYGFLANRSTDFERCQKLLGVHRPQPPVAEALAPEDLEDRRCPKCHTGRLRTLPISPYDVEPQRHAARPSRLLSLGVPSIRSPPLVASAP